MMYAIIGSPRVVHDAMHLTEEERMKAIEISAIPPLDIPENTNPVFGGNFETSEVWWEYEEIPIENVSKTLEQDVEELKQIVADLALLQLEVL